MKPDRQGWAVIYPHGRGLESAGRRLGRFASGGVEVEGQDRIVAAVKLHTWAFMVALVLAGLFRGPDLSAGREQADLEAV